MESQFERFELLIGKETLEALKKKHVAVFGLGGVGGHVVDALIRSGIENITLIDNDKVALSNLNRQLIANQNTIGLDKVDVMKKHILNINPSCNVFTHKVFFLNNDVHIDFSLFDYVVDAIDTISAKIEIARICNELNIPLISSMGTGNKLDPTKLEVSDIYKTSVCPLAKVMRHELKKRNIKKLKVVYSKELPIKLKEDVDRKVKGSTAFVPSCAGLIIASVVINDLIKEVTDERD